MLVEKKSSLFRNDYTIMFKIINKETIYATR